VLALLVQQLVLVAELQLHVVVVLVVRGRRVMCTGVCCMRGRCTMMVTGDMLGAQDSRSSIWHTRVGMVAWGGERAAVPVVQHAAVVVVVAEVVVVGWGAVVWAQL
jgi:hypothetical protein